MKYSSVTITHSGFVTPRVLSFVLSHWAHNNESVKEAIQLKKLRLRDRHYAIWPMGHTERYETETEFSFRLAFSQSYDLENRSPIVL